VVCELRREHPRWGPLRLAHELARADVARPGHPDQALAEDTQERRVRRVQQSPQAAGRRSHRSQATVTTTSAANFPGDDRSEPRRHRDDSQRDLAAAARATTPSTAIDRTNHVNEPESRRGADVHGGRNHPRRHEPRGIRPSETAPNPAAHLTGQLRRSLCCAADCGHESSAEVFGLSGRMPPNDARRPPRGYPAPWGYWPGMHAETSDLSPSR
jgi:hypothetical protein